MPVPSSGHCTSCSRKVSSADTTFIRSCYHCGMTDGQFKAVFIIVVILAFMAGALLAVVWR